MTLIRTPKPSDQAFVASTWVRSLSGIGSRDLNAHATAISDRVDAILSRDDTRVLIRHAPQEPDVIYGWVAFVHGPRVPVIHFAYTRKEYRGERLRERGIAMELLAAAGATPQRAVVYTSLGNGQAARKLITMYPAATHMPLEEFLSPPKTQEKK